MRPLRLPVLFTVALLSLVQTALGAPDGFGAGTDCAAWDATPQVVLPASVGAIHKFADPVVDSTGNVLVAYSRETTNGVTIESVESVGSSGAWSAPQIVAVPANVLIYSQSLELVIDQDDEVTLAWRDFAGAFLGHRLVVSRRVGGVWSAPQVIHTASSQVTSIELGVDADGDVLLTYDADVGLMNMPDVYARRFEKDTATWSWGGVVAANSFPPPVYGIPWGGIYHTTFVSTPDQSELYVGFFSGQKNGVFTRKWDASADAFGPAQFVPLSEEFLGISNFFPSRLSLVAGGDGELTLFWERFDGSAYEQLASRTVGGTWGAPHPIAPPSAFSHAAKWADSVLPAVNEHGDVLCAFAYQDMNETVLRVAEYDVTFGWKPEIDLRQVAGPNRGYLWTTGAAWLGDQRAFVTYVDSTGDLRSIESNGMCWSAVDNDVGGTFSARFGSLATSGDDVVLVYDRQNTVLAYSADQAIEANWHRGSQGAVPVSLGGLPGVAGTPVLAPACELTSGQPYSMSLTGASPAAQVVTFVGLSFAGTPFLGGVLVPTPDRQLVGVTDPSGSLQVDFHPPALGPGSTVWAQSWIRDPAAPQGASASNAICAQASTHP